jgi:hypothetical protein
MDEGGRRDIEECIRDAAVTVPCEDEDRWNSKRYAVVSRVAVEATTPTSPPVSDAVMGPEMCTKALVVCSSQS